MRAFDIPSHSRRITGLAMGMLAVVGMAAFTEGFLRQLASDTSAPPPRTSGAFADIAEAKPAPIPALQAPEAPRPKKAVAEDTGDEADTPAAPPAADAPPTASGAAPAAAADAAATASEAPAPAPQSPPAAEEAPT